MKRKAKVLIALAAACLAITCLFPPWLQLIEMMAIGSIAILIGIRLLRNQKKMGNNLAL